MAEQRLGAAGPLSGVHTAIVMTITALLLVAAAAPQEPEREPTVTRQDLAVEIQRLDALLAPRLHGGDPERALRGDELRAVNERFDRLSLTYFKGNLEGAHGELRAWVRELGGADEERLASGAQGLGARRRAVEERIGRAKIEDDSALRVLRSRLELLVDTPSPERSREFLLATDALAAEVEAEAAALIAGEDPYQDRPGDIWRTVARGRRDLPVRVYRPPGIDGPLPLVIALHGAGGDENFLFELAGDGYLKRLADAHGFVVACPVTLNIAAGVPALRALVAGLREDYSLTEDPPLLFGHSLGAMGVSLLLARDPGCASGAVCFAGFGRGLRGGPPVLVLGAEFDPIARPGGLKRGAETAAKAGADVTFELLRDQGHTLALTEALDRAVSFWGLDE